MNVKSDMELKEELGPIFLNGCSNNSPSFGGKLPNPGSEVEKWENGNMDMLAGLSSAVTIPRKIVSSNSLELNVTIKRIPRGNGMTREDNFVDGDFDNRPGTSSASASSSTVQDAEKVTVATSVKKEIALKEENRNGFQEWDETSVQVQPSKFRTELLDTDDTEENLENFERESELFMFNFCRPPFVARDVPFNENNVIEEFFIQDGDESEDTPLFRGQRMRRNVLAAGSAAGNWDSDENMEEERSRKFNAYAIFTVVWLFLLAFTVFVVVYGFLKAF